MMRHNMVVSRTNMDVAVLEPAYGVQEDATKALVHVYARLGTPEAIMCFACARVFVWSDGAAREDDILPAAFLHIERKNLPPASALLCRQCNNDAAVERALAEMFEAEDIVKIRTDTHGRKRMKGILIDPVAKTVTDIEVEDWEAVKKIIGCKWLEGVTIARIADHSEQVLVNEEGLLADEPGPFFQIGNDTPIAGKGVVLGVNYEGETISTRLKAEQVAPRISFPDVVFTGFTTTEDDPIHPLLGPVHRITRTANFKPRGE